MPRHSILDSIRALDPVADHQRIVFLCTCYEFPFDTTRALEFALFRTFCVPSISALLDQTGEFFHRSQKRYDDTDIIVSHQPPYGYGDQLSASSQGPSKSERLGSMELLATLDRIKPKAVVCGHFHSGRGTYSRGNTAIYNVAVAHEP